MAHLWTMLARFWQPEQYRNTLPAINTSITDHQVEEGWTQLSLASIISLEDAPQAPHIVHKPVSESVDEQESKQEDLGILDERSPFFSECDNPLDELRKIWFFMCVVEYKVYIGKYKSAQHSEFLGDNLDMFVIPTLMKLSNSFPDCEEIAHLLRRLQRFNQLPMIQPFVNYVIHKSVRDISGIRRHIEKHQISLRRLTDSPPR
jgi:hypothetical protein